MTRALGLEHIQGTPQQRRCQCDRPVPIREHEPTMLSDTPEPVTRCAKCGHRTTA